MRKKKPLPISAQQLVDAKRNDLDSRGAPGRPVP
jgi:hypothetical protein